MAFRDGLGERRATKDAAGASTEALCIRRELATAPSFEFALRERVTRLAGFRHAYYGRVRGVERSTESDQALTITSDATTGIRLSALLDTADEQRMPIELDVALCLIRQLVPAVAILHETARDASHGALGPERLIVTPNGRLVIVEYVLGSALEQLLFTRERYWTELRIALPRISGLPRFDHLTDVTQVGVVALSLILGRTLRDQEYPARIGEVVAAAAAKNSNGQQEPLPAGIRSWLQRALQLDARNSFPSAIEARAEFERVLADSGCDASPEKLDAFLARYHKHGSSQSSAAAPTLKTPAPIFNPPPVLSPNHPALVIPAAGPTPIPNIPVASGLEPAVKPVSAPVLPTPVVLTPIPPITPVSVAKVASASRPTTPEAPSAPAAEPKVTANPSPKFEKPMFGSQPESQSVAPPKPHAQRAGGKLVKIAGAGAIAVVVIGAVALMGTSRFWTADVPPPSPTGTLVVTTNPAGAEAFVDGVRRGNTPLTVQLLAGAHNVELRGRGEPRVIPVTIAPGQQIAQYVDLPNVPVPEPTPAPPEASSPVEHAASETPANGPGWISVGGKLEMQIFEGGQLLGTSKIERIMVPAGRHDLEFVSELIGYRGTRSLQVSPGKVTKVAVDLPKGSMAINALPWAEVWLDGAKVGETPIGNFAVPAGSHDVVFRHPEFGEKHETVLVTLKNPVKLSVDMRKP